MKIKELRKLDTKDLNEKLAEARNKTRELRFSIANNQLKKVRDLRRVKHDIARILTVLNEKRKETENKPKAEGSEQSRGKEVKKEEK